MRIDTWWPRLASDTQAWLIEHNGEPLPPGVKAEILTVNGGSTEPSWWAGELGEGQTELSDAAVDWIESVANDEGI
ncbi:hypothetical protein GOPIP_057_00640 [Gordonia polyisoprenivorans NBRC 16320 = JCM 10675]|uniref:Uncharacterized protein n=1 Tax=Gordonia polyisoprenivorans TaxID=84595 RepID=A0A846WMG3_9ACTN|nr:hypothetical protein [Gordonia polyisoprenivorans]NKY01980.1 hypothetical protein [Gordonia polyisoprenivorans]UZF54909.1 hypothetical protein LH935_19575 [Gordonia polyisoprenivorans]GAB23746.1 hypothetical protein GOPIP_057_00640 [Gordonia polyisoprenivorans NBRC 16320 = JCM 10675]